MEHMETAKCLMMDNDNKEKIILRNVI